MGGLGLTLLDILFFTQYFSYQLKPTQPSDRKPKIYAERSITCDLES